MITYAETYAQRVEDAITAQGLRRAMHELTVERIPFTVEQTGGMTMVGFTELPDGTLIAWNSESVEWYESAWAYAAGSEGDDFETTEDVCSTVYERMFSARYLEPRAEVHANVWYLWHTMDADTYAKDRRIRAEIAHRIGRDYSLAESIADNYGSIPDNIPSAQDYADTIATQYADMFPEG